MSMEEGMLKDHLMTAIEYNSVINYLEGNRTYYYGRDWREPNSPHDYYTSAVIYNHYFKEHPETHLDKLFEMEIEKRLLIDDCPPIEIYKLFQCIVAQAEVEYKGKNSFKMSKQFLEIVKEKLTEKIISNKSQLEQMSDFEGQYYSGGLYDYMVDENQSLIAKGGCGIVEL